MTGETCNNNHSTQILAYLGDAVFELCVREWLINNHNVNVREYNRQAKKFVSAGAQAVMYHGIYDLLPEDEQDMLRRGRNLNTGSRAKNADMSDYRHATGLETLFGNLFATGRQDRIKEVFDLCVNLIKKQ